MPGLATEAETVEALERKLQALIPELLELNEHLVLTAPVPFELIARKHSTLRKSA